MAAAPSSEDLRFMRRALALAARARGLASPNPMVGCVVVRGGKVVGEGYHKAAGTPHAEVHAFRAAGARVRGATVYVTLEPCASWGRTPPCVDAVLAARPKRVVVAMEDPNPLTAGRSLARMREAGIAVEVGLLGAEARELNAAFAKYIVTGMPYVVLKAALTLDGKVAARTGDSKWITGEAARADAHRWRGWSDAILVGSGTVKADDPALTNRLASKRLPSPTRVVFDPELQTSPKAKVLQGASRSGGGAWVLCGPKAPDRRARALEDAGAEIIRLPLRKGGFAWEETLKALGSRGVASVLLEGGPRLWTSAFEAGVVDRFVLYYAPKLLGGAESLPFLAGRGPARMEEALGLRVLRREALGEDWVVEAVPRSA